MSNNDSSEDNTYASGGEEPLKLNLLSVKKMGKVSEGTKALVYLLWKRPNKSLGKVDKAKIDSELAKFDILAFDWTQIPKHVFEEIFQKFSYEQICYICGCKGIQFDPKLMRSSGFIGGKSKATLIEKLWNLMQGSSTA